MHEASASLPPRLNPPQDFFLPSCLSASPSIYQRPSSLLSPDVTPRGVSDTPHTGVRDPCHPCSLTPPRRLTPPSKGRPSPLRQVTSLPRRSWRSDHQRCTQLIGARGQDRAARPAD